MMSRLFIILFFLHFSLTSQNVIDTKTFGQKILNGSVKPLDNDITFRTLDSLFCKNPTKKDFYFSVANKIQTLSDGALSEFFSVIASKYYMCNNMEFVRHSEKLPTKEIQGWLNHVAFDIAASEQSIQSLPKIKKHLDDLVINCNCPDRTKTLIG